MSKHDLSVEGKPCILYGQLYTTYNREVIHKVLSKTNNRDENLFYGKSNDVIIPASGETAEDISTACCVIEDNIIFGGDLNVIRTNHDGCFLSYQLNGVRKYDVAKLAVGKSVVHLHNDQIKNLKCYFPNRVEEEKKVVKLLDYLDTRIETQNKIIEDISIAINSIRNRMFCVSSSIRLGDIIEEVSERNKNNILYGVYSVSNKLGFVKQSDQFDGREIASENKTNYKIICTDNFAYNPARINVGSIGLYKGEDKIIISPMYLCFKIIDSKICPEALFSFFKSASFAHQLNNKLEGSVRQCLTIESLKTIKVPFVSTPLIENYQSLISSLINKLNNEKKILEHQIKQKNYLLTNMFI